MAYADDGDDVIVLSDDEDVYDMEEICDVRFHRHRFEYQIRWAKSADLTWEPSDCFIGDESKAMLEQYNEENREKIDELLIKEEERRSRKLEHSKIKRKTFEISEVDPELEQEENPLAPRELTEKDEFYGGPVSQLQGERKRLFDPTHRLTETDLLLAQMPTEGRVSRSRTAELKKVADGSAGEETRSPTPSVSAAEPRKLRRRKKNDNEPADEKPKTTRTRRKPVAAKSVEPVTDDYLQDTTIDDATASFTHDSSIFETNDDPAEEVPLVLPTKKRQRRKRVMIEPDDVMEEEKPSIEPMATSSVHEDSPPFEEKRPTNFIGRDDDDEACWLPTMNVSTFKKGKARDDCQQLIGEALGRPKLQNATVEDLLNAILAEDVALAQILISKLDRPAAQNMLLEWRDRSTGKPMLHTLMNSNKFGKRGKGDPTEWLSKLIISISKQNILAVEDGRKNMPIHEAVIRRKAKLIRVLAYSGTPLSIPNANRSSPLDIAVSQNDLESVRFLLERGCTFHHLFDPKHPLRKEMSLLMSKRISDVSNSLGNELLRVRRRLYKKGINEVMTVSPIMIAPRHDSNVVNFEFFYRSGRCESKNQGHMMFMFPVAYHTPSRRWLARSTNLCLDAAPLFNGTKMVHCQQVSYPNAFFAAPMPGVNHLHIILSNNSWNKDYALAVSCVRYELTEPPVPGHSRHAY